MKIGVLIIGEYREFKTAVNSWSFIQNKNIDFHIASWNESNQEIVENVDNESFTKHLPNNIKSLQIIDTKFIKKTHTNIIDTSQCFRFLWEVVYKFLKSSYKDDEYDYIFITRPDLWYSFSEPFLEESFLKKIKDNTVYTNRHAVQDDYFVHDIYFLGKGNTIMSFMEKCIHIPIEHRGVGKIIKENFISDSFGELLSATIVRPNSRKIPKNKWNREMFRLLDIDWSRWKDEIWNNK